VLEPDEDPATVSDAEVEMRLKISHEIPMHRVGKPSTASTAPPLLAMTGPAR
jgi:hypothetical protein